MSLSDTIGLVVKFFLLLTPFFILSIFVSVTAGMERGPQRSLAHRTTLAVLITCVVLYLFGELIFRYLGITLNAFRIGAGLVLILNGIDLVRGSGVPEARKVEDGGSDLSVVPLAIPYTVGPGTIGALLVMGGGVKSNQERVMVLIAIAIACVLLGVVLHYADALERLLKTKGLSILSKLTGMFLVALAAQIIFQGIKEFLNL